MKFHKWFTPNFSTTRANFQSLSQLFKIFQTCLCKLGLWIYRASIFKRPLYFYMESIPHFYSCCHPTYPNYKVVVLQESPLYLCAVVKVKMNSTLHKPTMLRTGQRTLPIFFTARSQDMLDGRLWWRALTTTYFPPSRFVVWENATFSL